jgi:hypothetical protein
MRWWSLMCALVIGCGSQSDDGSGASTDDADGSTQASGGKAAAGGGGSATGGSGGKSAAGGGGPGSGGKTAAGGSGASGGAPNTGGSLASGGNPGDATTGSAESCETAPTPGLPAGAPALTKGTWTTIGPPQVPFAQDPSGHADANTQGMAIDPCNPAVLYLCAASLNPSVGHPGVYKTTDAGGTWRKVGQLDTPLHVRVDPKNPNHLYANDGVWGSTQGFWVSNDGGETWTTPQGFKDVQKTAGLFAYDTYDVVADPSDFRHVLLSFHSAWGWTDTKWDTNAGVLESTDGGETWIVHDPQPGWGAGHAINFLYRPDLGIGDSKTWLLGAQGPGLFRTSDAGATWTKVSDLGIQHGGGTIYYTKTGVLYASGAAENQRSTDNGLTWTKVGPGQGFNGIIGDGTRLYTGRCFGPAPFLTSAENDGTTWTDYNAQKFGSGPFELGYDSINGIVYSASWGAGMWALKP